jgi:hypothetical protein
MTTQIDLQLVFSWIDHSGGITSRNRNIAAAAGFETSLKPIAKIDRINGSRRVVSKTVVCETAGDPSFKSQSEHRRVNAIMQPAPSTSSLRSRGEENPARRDVLRALLRLEGCRQLRQDFHALNRFIAPLISRYIE